MVLRNTANVWEYSTPKIMVILVLKLCGFYDDTYHHPKSQVLIKNNFNVWSDIY